MRTNVWKTSPAQTLLADCLTAAIIIGVLLVGALGVARALPASLLADVPPGTEAPSSPDPAFVSRIAGRLAKRLQSRGMFVPQTDVIERAVAQRQQLLRAHIAVQFTWSTGIAETWEAGPQVYPGWIVASFTPERAGFFLDPAIVQADIAGRVGEKLVEPQHVTLTAVDERENGFLRAQTSGVAKEGDVLDMAAAATVVLQAIGDGQTSLTIPIEHVAGKIDNQTGQDLGSLQLLGVGRSNFRGSGAGRIANVRKALREHVNNTVVAPGELFSFNATLEGPVTTNNGWYMAKVIVEGSELVDAPGGGICQASTTVFRAMLNAGFTPVDRKAHSLYVTYYEEYGVGIDATVFPGSQDLTFVNDTPGYLLVQAYDDGFEAYVSIYGTDDGREVAVQGPYFASTAVTSAVPVEHIQNNEIAWVQTVRYADGREVQNVIRSRYKWIPKSLAQKYVMHASAE